MSLLDLRHDCGDLHGRLPPEGEAQTDDPVKRAPYILRRGLIPSSKSVTCTKRAIWDGDSRFGEWSEGVGDEPRCVEENS